MFRQLNKVFIWLLCQCVNNCLWNSSKLPFTGAVLQSASLSKHPHARPRWSAQGTGTVSLSVSKWYQISPAIQVHTFKHLGNAHSKQWAVLIASSLWAYLVWSFGLVIELLCTLFFVRIRQPAACGIFFLNNHKNWKQPWTAVFIFLNHQNLPQIRKCKLSQHYTK